MRSSVQQFRSWQPHPAACAPADGSLCNSSVILVDTFGPLASRSAICLTRAATRLRKLMIAIMWQFDVKTGQETEFEQLYGVEGRWPY